MKFSRRLNETPSFRLRLECFLILSLTIHNRFIFFQWWYDKHKTNGVNVTVIFVSKSFPIVTSIISKNVQFRWSPVPLPRDCPVEVITKINCPFFFLGKWAADKKLFKKLTRFFNDVSYFGSTKMRFAYLYFLNLLRSNLQYIKGATRSPTFFFRTKKYQMVPSFWYLPHKK